MAPTADAHGNLHHQAGTPASIGGQFAAKQRGDADVALRPRYPVTIGISARAKLTVDSDPLPPLPEAVGWPTNTSLAYGDSDNCLYVYFTFADGAELTVWLDADGDARNSIEDSNEPTGWDEDTDEAVLAWAHDARQRIDYASATVREAASDAVEKQVIAVALAADRVHPIDAMAQVLGDDAPARGAARGAKLATLFGDNESAETDIQDALSDLMHFARARGVDFADVTDSARRIYESEIEDPNG